MGEKLEALEAFHPTRVAARILDMGDVVSLVEKAAETLDRHEAEKIAAKMKKGSFDMNDLSSQLNQMKKLGGMKGVLGMLPGVEDKIKGQLAAAGMDDRILTRQDAIICSMTKHERVDPDVINGSRRKRIAAGAGVDVSEVNKLLKMHRQMADMMKKMGKGGRACRKCPVACLEVFRPNFSGAALDSSESQRKKEWKDNNGSSYSSGARRHQETPALQCGDFGFA